MVGQAVNAAVVALGQDDINRLDAEGSISLEVEGQNVTVERTDVEIISEDMPGWTVANEGSLTVALDLEITPALRQEGLAREVVKRIQAYRKDSGFDITDRILVEVERTPLLADAVNEFADYIAKQVLADRVENTDGKVIKQYEPEAYGQLMKQKEAKILRGMMRAVVTDGTASALQSDAYNAAGKTGSAEYGTTKGDSHAWFTGFAPAEDPEVCVTIIVEGAGSGGDYAENDGK